MDPWGWRSIFKKAAAIGLSILVADLQGVSLRAESSFWESRRAAAQRRVAPARALSLSSVGERVFPLGREKPDPSSPLGLRRIPPLGTAHPRFPRNRPTFSPKNRKTIIIIQDIHQNARAQGNIARAVRSLIEEGGLDFIALEGAFGPIDLSHFGRFPDQESVLEAAEYLLGQNRISGPILSVLSSSSSVPLIGVDDRDHYRANVEAYRQSLPGSTEIKARWAKAQISLQERKKRNFNGRLAVFDGKVQAYQDGLLSLGEYIESAPFDRDFQFPEAAKFIEAYRREKKIDFKRVEADRTSLARELVDRLTPDRYSSLIDSGAAYREGKIRYASLYTRLSALCREASINLTRYPALNGYIRYVALADSIDVKKLLSEVQRLEKKAYASLAVTPAEKSLIRETRSLRLTRKLLDFSLTREDWDEYERCADSLSVVDGQPFESFYREALARDEAMSRNLLALFESQGASRAVLVSGGFHSSGIEERLTAAGVEVVTYAPQIDRIDSDAGTALSVFSREKSPLDTLFHGQTLFLAAPPITPEIRDTHLPLLVAGRRLAMLSAKAVQSQSEGTVRSDFHSLSAHPDAPKAVVRAHRLADNQVGIHISLAEHTVSLLIEFKGPKYKIVAERAFRPGEERTLERGRRWLGSIFIDSIAEKAVRLVLAPLVEWSVFTRAFVVNHHPATYEEWIEILSMRRWILTGALGGTLVGVLLVLLLPAGPALNFLVVVTGLILGKMIAQSGLNAVRLGLGRVTATESMPDHLSDPDAVERGRRINQHPASLAVELTSAWNEKMESEGVFKYTLDQVSFSPLGRFRKIFNPGRGGKRPRQMDVAHLNQPFNLDAFNFDSPKMNPVELLAEGVIVNGVETDFVVNVNPLAKGHFLITPERRSRHHQYFFRKAALAALGTVALFGSGLKVGYNSVGAFASINHLHLQGIPYLQGDRMPVEREFTDPQRRALLLSDGDLQLWQLTRWPIQGYVLTGQDQNALADRLVVMANVLQKENQPFNMIFTRREAGEFVAYIMPRQPEKPTKFGTGVAFFECAGEIPFVKQGEKTMEESLADFREADEHALEEELRSNDLDEERKSEIREMILKHMLEVAARRVSPPPGEEGGTPGAFKFWEHLGVSSVWAGRIEGAMGTAVYLILFIFQVGIMNVPPSDVAWLQIVNQIITPAIPIVSAFLMGHLFFGVYGKVPKNFQERFINALSATWTAVRTTLLVPALVAIVLATASLVPTGLALDAVIAFTVASGGWWHGQANRKRSAIQSALPLETFSVNDLNHRWAFVHQVSQKIQAGDPAAEAWAKTVDTLATLAVVRGEDISLFRSLLAKTVYADGQNNLHFLLVPGDDNPDLAKSLDRLAKEDRRVTVLHPTYAPGVVLLSGREIADWARNKGGIFWTAFRNVGVKADIVNDGVSLPAVIQTLLDLLRHAPPISGHDFNAMIEFSRIVSAAA